MNIWAANYPWILLIICFIPTHDKKSLRGAGERQRARDQRFEGMWVNVRICDRTKRGLNKPDRNRKPATCSFAWTWLGSKGRQRLSGELAFILVFRISIWIHLYCAAPPSSPQKPRWSTFGVMLAPEHKQNLLEWRKKTTSTPVTVCFSVSKYWKTSWRHFPMALSLWRGDGGCEHCGFICVYKSPHGNIHFSSARFLSERNIEATVQF